MNRPILTRNFQGATERAPDVTFVEVAEQPKPTMQRAPRKIEVAPPQEKTPTQLCLDHWREWMQRDDRDLGAKGQSGLRSGSDDRVTDDAGAASDAAADRASREIAMATDAMIESLDRHHKAAIYRVCNISSVWRFPNLDFTVALPEAEAELTEKLKRNVATRAFF
jgi:hypothetical protein